MNFGFIGNINGCFLSDCWGRRRLISICAPQSADGTSSLLQSNFPNEIGKFPSASGKPNSDGCPDCLYLHGGEKSCLESDVVLSNKPRISFQSCAAGLWKDHPYLCLLWKNNTHDWISKRYPSALPYDTVLPLPPNCTSVILPLSLFDHRGR